MSAGNPGMMAPRRRWAAPSRPKTFALINSPPRACTILNKLLLLLLLLVVVKRLVLQRSCAFLARLMVNICLFFVSSMLGLLAMINLLRISQ